MNHGARNTEHGARRTAPLAAIMLVLIGCAPVSVRSVVDDYERAMSARPRHSGWASRSFERVREDAGTLLEEGALPTQERVLLASLRIRACIELEDDAGADTTIATHHVVFRTLDADARYPGDIAGIALMKAAVATADPDRALGHLIAAEERVTGPRTRAYLDLRKVGLLLSKARLEPDKARAGRALDTVLALCEANKEDDRFAAPRRQAESMRK